VNRLGLAALRGHRERQPGMTRISFSPAAYDAICSTLPENASGADHRQIGQLPHSRVRPNRYVTVDAARL
jgi:hypothetical protein